MSRAITCPVSSEEDQTQQGALLIRAVPGARDEEEKLSMSINALLLSGSGFRSCNLTVTSRPYERLDHGGSSSLIFDSAVFEK